jgi:D-alanyl-D-alanine carboxypeptidase/D-alanyl-D-alanine-endopeptidase (penicillin-binding protein 4)
MHQPSIRYFFTNLRLSRLAPWVLTLAVAAGCASALAQPLPSTVVAALARAQIPQESVSLLLVDADGLSPPRLIHRGAAAVNPASVMKLVTTFAALDLLGPAWVWRTPVWLDGRISQGVLKGNLVIKGSGDPKLVTERLWLLLQRLQGLGLRQIDGDIVFDRSAFAPLAIQAGDFDGEPFRPYNVTPDALLFNFKSVSMTFAPNVADKLAHVTYDPPLAGVRLPVSVPLLSDMTVPCNDYRARLLAEFSDPTRISFAGAYPATCGEKVWSVAYADPASFNARSIEGLWRSMGGQLTGRVRDGNAPEAPATFVLVSPTLAEVVRDINKFSNNVMARQLFLSLAVSRSDPADRASTVPAGPATQEMARDRLQNWWQQRISTTDLLVLDNGAGLSRLERITAQGLVRMLQVAYASPNMSELMSSLPIVGIDGTLKRSLAPAASAHLKTGSLRDVMAVAGYVHGTHGKQMCLVAIVNHTNAAAARPALDALLTWAVSDNAGL